MWESTRAECSITAVPKFFCLTSSLRSLSVFCLRCEQKQKSLFYYMPEKTSSSWGVWHCVKLLLVLLGSRFLGIESVSTTLFGPFPKADNALARSEVFRSICSKKDRMQSCNVIRSPVNTSHSHRAVRLLSSWMASARDLHHARLHQILSHHWHSQIPAYLLTHLFLLHLATLQARTCRIVHSFFFFMRRWRATVIQTDIVRAKDWLIPSRARA